MTLNRDQFKMFAGITFVIIGGGFFILATFRFAPEVNALHIIDGSVSLIGGMIIGVGK